MLPSSYQKHFEKCHGKVQLLKKCDVQGPPGPAFKFSTPTINLKRMFWWGEV